MILLLDEEPGNSEELNNEKDNAESSSDESPPVDEKDMPSNGNNFLRSKG